MIVRTATPQDAAALAAFGRRVFHDTFAPDNRPDDLAAYLEGAYSPERQLAEIEDVSVNTLLLEIDGALAAFAQVRAAEAPAGVEGTHPIELWRFYVDPAWHGRGVAAALMDTVLDAARRREARTLWLGVWERNTRAQAFYRKQGFAVAGSHIFMLGADAQRDLIMLRSL
ncbi:MAG: GNAT family N-acetyltransferase [Vicinamibacterales bacterium]